MDKNPFDDPFSEPAPQSNYLGGASTTSRQAELDAREAELERRERELNQRQEHVRRFGRNNFPPCTFIPPKLHAYVSPLRHLNRAN